MTLSFSAISSGTPNHNKDITEDNNNPIDRNTQLNMATIKQDQKILQDLIAMENSFHISNNDPNEKEHINRLN